MVIWSGLVLGLLLIFGFKEFPDSPPSALSAKPDNQLGFIDSMREVYRHKKLLKTAGVAFTGLGCMWGFFGVNSIYLKASGLTDKQTGIYGMAIILVGSIIGTYMSRFTAKIGKNFLWLKKRLSDEGRSPIGQYRTQLVRSALFVL